MRARTGRRGVLESPGIAPGRVGVYLAFCLPLLPFLLGAPAAAQQADTRLFSLRSTVSLDAQYTDNFSLTARQKQDEYREILTPGLALRMSGGTGEVNLLYAPSLIHSSLDEGTVNLFHRLDADAVVPLLARLKLRGADHFIRTDEQSVTDPRNLTRSRSILLQNAFSSVLTYDRDTWSLSPRYSLTYNQTESSVAAPTTSGSSGAAPSPAADSFVHTIGLDGVRQIGQRNKVTAGYELTLAQFADTGDFTGQTVRASFDRELSPVTTASVQGFVSRRDPDQGDSFNFYGVDAGLHHNLGPRLAIDARAGADATDLPDQIVPTYLVSGTYTGRMIRVSLRSTQSVQETFLERVNVGLIRTLDNTLEVRYEPTDRLAVTGLGGVSQTRFLQQTAVSTSGGATHREDLAVTAGLQMTYRLSRLLFFTVDYAYANVDSNQAGLDYDRNTVKLGLTARFE